ncbi:MAG: GtrA family protein [Acidimicrobiales bacterium]
MEASPRGLIRMARSPEGTKLVRYSLVSVVSVIVSLIVYAFTRGVLNLWTPVICNVVACAVSTVPSYELNRRWAWGKTDQSHFWKEVAPFWALAFVGLAFSTLAVGVVHGHEHDLTSSHRVATILEMGANLGAFGALWIAKFFIFNKLLFVHRMDELPEVLDGRTGVPV